MRTLAASLTLVAVLALGAASRGGATPPADLLQTYAPVLLFHQNEEWAPEAVESYLALARVERQQTKGAWTVVPPPLPTSATGCTTTPCLRLDLPCPLRGGLGCYRSLARTTNWSAPVVYGNVVRVPATAPAPPGFTKPPALLVHYWLFYAFDDWRSPRERLWQVHEGDWESITIGLDQSETPVFAAYSEHCSGSVQPWAAVTKRGGTHPVAYVALGSHANWFSATPADTRFSECLKGVAGSAARKASALVSLARESTADRMGSAHPLGAAGVPGVTPARVVQVPTATTPWARFPGRWGEGQILWLGSKPRSYTTVSEGYGPGTPNWGATTVSASWHPATG